MFDVSTGAAVGPLLAGFVSDMFGWEYVFFMLMISDLLSLCVGVIFVVGNVLFFFAANLETYFTDAISTDEKRIAIIHEIT